MEPQGRGKIRKKKESKRVGITYLSLFIVSSYRHHSGRVSAGVWKAEIWKSLTPLEGKACTVAWMEPLEEGRDTKEAKHKQETERKKEQVLDIKGAEEALL